MFAQKLAINKVPISLNKEGSNVQSSNYHKKY